MSDHELEYKKRIESMPEDMREHYLLGYPIELKCTTKDMNGNHCPEKPTVKVDLPGSEPFWLCDRCYKRWKDMEKSPHGIGVVKYSPKQNKADGDSDAE